MLQRNFKYLLLTLSLLFSTLANASAVNSLFHRGGDPVIGNPKGNVTVVEFFDYQCSHCANMASVMDAIVKANPNVRVVYKEFPIRGPMSDLAARAALAANKQGKYYQFNHVLFNMQPISEENILDAAKNNGLDAKRLKKDMDSTSTRRELAGNLQLGQQVKITGTPAFFIGKTNAKNDADIDFVLGEMSEGQLQSAIDKAKQ